MLLLLHGTGAATHSWRDLAPLLARDFTIVAPDLPGHGFTQAPESDRLSLPAMARAVAALLKQLALAPELIVGHSAGVAIALRMVLDKAVTPARRHQPERRLAAVQAASPRSCSPRWRGCWC